MKSISINRLSALSIMMGAVLASTDNSLDIRESSKRGTNFQTAYEEENPGKKLSDNYAVGLLEGDTEKGRHLKLGIQTLHHDPNSFDSQQELKNLFNGDRTALKRVTDAGAIVALFIDSPAFQAEYNNPVMVGEGTTGEVDIPNENPDGDDTDASSGFTEGGKKKSNLQKLASAIQSLTKK